MTMQQRTVWAQLFVFPVVGIIYFSVVLSRAANTPLEEVSWVVPLVWAMGVSVVGIIAFTIVGAVAHGVRATARGEEPEFEDGDIRDKEIEREGDYRSHSFTAIGGLAVIVLAMLRVDHFWIANALFLAGLLGGVYGTAIKLRMYRRGF